MCQRRPDEDWASNKELPLILQYLQEAQPAAAVTVPPGQAAGHQSPPLPSQRDEPKLMETPADPSAPKQHGNTDIFLYAMEAPLGEGRNIEEQEYYPCRKKMMSPGICPQPTEP